jgi:hypothetical protein
LFVFGSSLDDRETLDALASELPTPLDETDVAPAALDAHLYKILARAKTTVLELDAIGLTEEFEQSVELVFSILGLPVPREIVSEQVTDKLSDTIPGFARVPPVSMSPRLSRALQRLTKYDRVIYALAKEEFRRRRSLAQGIIGSCAAGKYVWTGAGPTATVVGESVPSKTEPNV